MRPLLVLLMLLVLGGCATGPSLAPPEDFARLAKAVTGDSAPTAADHQAELDAYRVEPDYPCRQPLYARYFAGRGVVAPAPVACSPQVPFAVLSVDEGVRIAWVDPARVSAVHVLFAGNSSSPASRFGHVALRLVVCPASDSSPGECDSNLAEHLLLSFQAHVDDYTLDVLKALGGEYQANLFASRFMDSYEQYAIGEFRELYSLPLRLDAPQRQALVRDLAQIHWRFAGSYDFFTRNCATLLQQALAASWSDYASDPVMAGGFLRPDHLFAALRESRLADGQVLATLSQAEHDGFYFSSTRPFYEQAVASVRGQHPGEAFSSLRGYIEIAPLRRALALHQSDYVKRLAADDQLLQAQLMLEEYALLSSQRLLQGYAAEYLRQQDLTARASTLDAEHGKVFQACFLQPLQQRNRPVRRPAGIPSRADSFADLPGPAAHCTSPHSRTLLAEAFASSGDDGSAQWRQLNDLVRYRADTLDNILFLRQLRP
ncbi:MAG: DUF4105 domain-containing protein [Paucimonas sp.]|jgi:hypothetical protein|nr:DUF4105 domain-containing protein [Paucimonas sp.]